MWRSLLITAAVMLATGSCATAPADLDDDRKWTRGKSAIVTGGSVRGGGD